MEETNQGIFFQNKDESLHLYAIYSSDSLLLLAKDPATDFTVKHRLLRGVMTPLEAYIDLIASEASFRRDGLKRPGFLFGS